MKQVVIALSAITVALLMLVYVWVFTPGRYEIKVPLAFASEPTDLAVPVEEETVIEEVVESEPEPITEPIYEQYPQIPYVYENVAPVGTQGQDFMFLGVIEGYGHRYTWYSSKVREHERTSEWTADADGIYRDADGYVVVAGSIYSEGTEWSRGGTVETPFGDGKYYDCGYMEPGGVDVYVNF